MLLSPPALATCYCIDPLGDDCRCTAPAAEHPEATFPGNQSGVEVKCTTEQETNSTFEKKNPICGSASETIPYCASVTYDPSRYFCYGRGFIPPDAVDDQIKSMPDNSWKVVNGPFQFNGTFGGSDAYNVYVCDAGVFCCAQPAGTCDDSGVPKGGSCNPQTGPGNPAVCENIPPPGTTGTPAPKPTPDYPPPGTLCENYEYRNEPHPLRPAPALVCQEDKVPDPWGLSCANDVLPTVTVQRPRDGANATCGPGQNSRLLCHREETLSESDIGTITITIDLTPLELPIAGIASRGCDSGECDVDKKKPDGKLYLSDGFKMRNYTSWYLQGAIEQAEQEPLDYFDAGGTLRRVLAYAGPIKKLVPEDVLNGQRNDLINMAKNGLSYNQIVGYVDGDQVIGRREARETGLTAAANVVRLKDMADHIAPVWDPHSHDGNKWYYLWQQTPFTGKDDSKYKPPNAGHVDIAGEFFPTACLPSKQDSRRCASDPKVLDAKLAVDQSQLDAFRAYFPHLVEDDTLLLKLLQSSLISQQITRPRAYPKFSQLSANLDIAQREPNWTKSDDHLWTNADGCVRENALYNPGDSLEAKRNKKQGIITAKLTFKKEVEYDYEIETAASLQLIADGELTPLPPTVPVEVTAPVPVHIRYSHMDEIGDRTVFGLGSIFKAVYPDIPTTIGKELIERPAESSITYRCSGGAGGSCKANSTSHKGQPMAFFPKWGSILELFHQKIQCALDPIRAGCAGLFTPEPPGGDNTAGGVCQDSGMKATHQPDSKQSAIIAAGAQECVDASILRAVLDIEAGPNYQPVPGSDACTVNACGAAGPMQILSGWDNVNCDPAQCNGNTCAGWCAKYAAADDAGKQHIRDLFAPPAGNLNVCNLDDALIVAAQKLKAKSLGKVSQLGCLHAIEADKEGLVRAVMSYYGNRYDPSLTPSQNCANPDDKIARLGNLTYCEYVFSQIGLTP